MEDAYACCGLWIEMKRMGFSKGTLHYMEQNAMSDKSFTLNAHVKARLGM